MNRKLKIAIVFLISYCLISILSLAAFFLLVPGFPFFPKVVFETRSEQATFSLPPGTFHILYFVEARKKLPISHGDIGIINLRRSDDSPSVPVTPLNYYFDSTGRARGHAVAKFSIGKSTALKMSTEFQRHGYAGAQIRTAIGTFLSWMLAWEAVSVFLAIVATYTFTVVRKVARTSTP
jgi:hypothetical protein